MKDNHNKQRMQLPGIGMRIIKSAIAVLICYIIDMLRGGQGMVFYSQLAALWCIQMYRSNTKDNAIQRSIGTSIGSLFGLIYLLTIPKLMSTLGWDNQALIPNLNLGLKLDIRLAYFVEALIISGIIILVLYSTVLIKKKQASYFSCVVFLSIVVNHASDMNPYLFVFNRFLDTMIGIGIGILVNDIRPTLHPDRDTLFISGLDDTLLNQQEMLSAFSKVELNRMIDSGMKFTISTIRTPAALLEPMRDVRLNIPVIAMDGAVLYDTRVHSYLKVYVISSNTSKRLMQMIQASKLCWYANVIIDDMLVIYYEEMRDEVNTKLVADLRTSPFRNYVKRPLPEDENVTYFMLLDKEEKIEAFYQQLVKEGITEELKVVHYPSDDYPGYAYIKIYNRNATKENMIMYLKEMLGVGHAVTFGTIEGQYDVFIHSNDANEVVRKVRKQYEPLIRKR